VPELVKASPAQTLADRCVGGEAWCLGIDLLRQSFKPSKDAGRETRFPQQGQRFQRNRFHPLADKVRQSSKSKLGSVFSLPFLRIFGIPAEIALPLFQPTGETEELLNIVKNLRYINFFRDAF